MTGAASLRGLRRTGVVTLAMFAAAVAVAQTMPPAPLSAPGAGRLAEVYGDVIERVAEGELVWRDGTRMAIDDGAGTKPFKAWLSAPDLKDMFAQAYPAGAPATAPPRDFDPGRARNAALFEKLYGDCRKGEVASALTDVVWLPKKYGVPLRFHGAHGAAERLAAVSARLDALPARFDVFLVPPAGTYNCRTIAGTERVSAHGFGIAIDLAVKRAHYWRWDNGPAGPSAYRNEIPGEIIAAFEAEGFIWGGRWSHYDTMHFEYRPELFAPVSR